MAVTTWTAGQVLAAQDLNDTFASKLDLAGGKILQIVRATDSTLRSTTSSAFVDANISVTITPQKSNSAILLIWSFDGRHDASADFSLFQIADTSNNRVMGDAHVGSTTTNDVLVHVTITGYSTPATTSATTYKGRFRVLNSGTARIENTIIPGELYAIEVSA